MRHAVVNRHIHASAIASTGRHAPHLVDRPSFVSILDDDPLDSQAGIGFEDACVLRHAARQKAFRMGVRLGSGSALFMHDDGTAGWTGADVFAHVMELAVLRDPGIGRSVSRGLHASRVRRQAVGLSVVRRREPAPVPESRRGRHLHCVSARTHRGNTWHSRVSRVSRTPPDFSTENVGKLVDILRTATLNP